VHLTGRHQAPLEAVADEIKAAGGTAMTAVVDAHDVAAVNAHTMAILASHGRMDVSFNAIDHGPIQGTALVDLALHDFMTPIVAAARTHFITATTAARCMVDRGSGVIILLSSSAAQESRHRMGGFNLACACVEALTRSLAGEVGPHGVRVVALRPNLIPETAPDMSRRDLEPLLRDTLTGRLPRLDEVAAAAAFLGSDHAGAITGAVINLTCGAIID
jgi:NAD(P)-dependent dehydrogenase (short-subunit alcohol dehydrogenase family)